MNAIVLGLGWHTAGSMGRGRDGSTFSVAPGPVTPPARGDLFAEPDKRFGRLDDFSKVGLAAATMALRDAGLEAWSEMRPVGLVAATVMGCLDTDAAYMATVLESEDSTGESGPAVSLASPHLFAFTLPNVFLGEVAIRFGLTGPMYALAEPLDSDLAGVREAMELLADKECAVLLAGCCNVAAHQWARQRGPAPPLPGALFLVLAHESWRGAATHAAPLGNIRLDGERQILCNGRRASRMEELARLCLEGA